MAKQQQGKPNFVLREVESQSVNSISLGISILKTHGRTLVMNCFQISLILWAFLKQAPCLMSPQSCADCSTNLSVSLPVEKTAMHVLKTLVYAASPPPKQRLNRQHSKIKEKSFTAIHTFLLQKLFKITEPLNQNKTRTQVARNKELKALQSHHTTWQRTHHDQPFPEVQEFCTIKSLY